MNWFLIAIGKILEKIKDPREALLYAGSGALIVFLIIKLSKSDETISAQKEAQHQDCIRKLETCENKYDSCVESREDLKEIITELKVDYMEVKTELEFIKKQINNDRKKR